MVRKIALVVLVLLAAGGWFYLDYLSKQEQLEAEGIKKAMALSHARAVAEEKARVEAKAKFESQILADLTNCRATAEKANADYITAHQKPVRRKPGQFTLPQAAADEAAKTLAAANAECQLNYDTRLKSGS